MNKQELLNISSKTGMHMYSLYMRFGFPEDLDLNDCLSLYSAYGDILIKQRLKKYPDISFEEIWDNLIINEMKAAKTLDDFIIILQKIRPGLEMDSVLFKHFEEVFKNFTAKDFFIFRLEKASESYFIKNPNFLDLFNKLWDDQTILELTSAVSLLEKAEVLKSCCAGSKHLKVILDQIRPLITSLEEARIIYSISSDRMLFEVTRAIEDLLIEYYWQEAKCV